MGVSTFASSQQQYDTRSKREKKTGKPGGILERRALGLKRIAENESDLREEPQPIPALGGPSRYHLKNSSGEGGNRLVNGK